MALLLLLLLLLLPSKIYSLLYQICGNTGYYTANSTYESNLDTLLHSLTSNGSISGFSTADVGRTPDQIYGLILCRGDTNTTLCRSCLNTAGQDIHQICPYNMDATVWYDRCLVRYSNQQFISSYNNSPIFYQFIPLKVDDPDRLDELVGELLDRISRWAAYNSSRRFATGEVYYSAEFPKVYGLAQCTVDLSGDQCRRCLQGFTDVNRTQFSGAKELIALGVRCNLRYGLHLFYDGASTLVLSSPPPPPISPPLDSLPNGEKVLYVPPTSGEPIYQFCSNTGYYIPNSTYQSNLDALLPSLISNGSLSGFSTAAVGRTPDQVYGLILCRGDTNATLCRSCLDTAGQDILQLCPYDVDATIWYDRCLLRYSNQQFISSYNNSPRFNLAMNQNVTDPGRYDKLVGELLDRVSRWAAYNSSRRFATGEVYYSAEFPKIYGLAQCTVDLSGDQCSRCFQGFTDVNRTRFNGAVEGFGLGVRCNFRYGLFLFYDGASTLVLSSPPPESPPLDSLQSGEKDSGNEKNVTDIILAISIPLVTALVVIVIVCICFWRRRPTIKPPYETKLEEIRRVKFKVFDLSTLVAATSNFSDVNKLGEGGFAAVYKGTLPNEGEIAVKRLSSSSVQGLGELKNELILVAKLQHRNLVSLLGVCLEEHEKLLVYEYVPNRSLDKFLFDPIKCRELNWARRYKIIGGIVRGLLYLHEDSQLKIIHRDLKASNILLDADMNPKISDFGLARLFGGDQTQGSTSRAVGTFGYMSPEYAMRGQISIKLDVFSFGVLVLEILTGRKHSGSFASENAKDLLSSTWEHWTRGTISEILDPTLDENCPKSEVLRCIRIGLLCVQDDPADRPSMSKVVVMLNSHSVSLQSPSRPTFNIRKSGMESDIFYKATHFQGGTGDQSSSKLISMTPNEVSISEIEPR